jgi:hypothetical protein
MVGTRRFFTLLVVALAFAAMVVTTGGASTRATVNPTIYFLYSMNCTFVIQDDSGKQISSIPPGHYQVDVRTPLQFGTVPPPPGSSPNDMTACRGAPQFQLTGPGVDLFTNMTAGCEADKVFPETFQPSSTYVAQDLNQPSVAHGSFTTTATGSSSDVSANYGGGKGHAELGQDIVGSLALKGTLNATLTGGANTVLTLDGRKVTTLKAGRYRFTVVDRDKKTGFKVLGPTSKTPIEVTGTTYTGKHSVVIPLTAGRWTYYSSLKTIRFIKVT